MFRLIMTITTAVALWVPVPQAAAESACGTRLPDLEGVIRDHSSEIPSGSMNRMFTLQEQIRTACRARNDELADSLMQELAALLAPDIQSERLDDIRRTKAGAEPGPSADAPQ